MENNFKKDLLQSTDQMKTDLKRPVFTGCGTAIVTPFKEDETIDEVAFRNLVEFQIKNGADAIIVCGSTGEAVTLSKKEQLKLVAYAVQIANGRVPIVAGTGANVPNEVIEMTRAVKQVGASAALVRTPAYLKTNQEGLKKFFAKIANEEHIQDFPIIMYNVPGRTGMNMEPETVFELSKIPNIVAIKEASGNLEQIEKIGNLCDSNFTIYSGNDDQNLDIYKLGGKGAISVLSNVMPNVVHNTHSNYVNGNIEKAQELQNNSMELINSLFQPGQPNPICIKEFLNIIGMIPNCTFRLPLDNIDENGLNVLKEMAEKYKDTIPSFENVKDDDEVNFYL